MNKALLQKKLLTWYTLHKRDLPWRRTKDPYKIWVSEVMLQQTQVDTVIPYYERWLKRFPTVEALAKANLDQVLKVWEGLGYYARARNLHKAAKVLHEENGGKFPDSYEEIRRLPGIGNYTAGAISSIAFNLPDPVLDGNVARVLCRLFAIHQDPKLPKTQNKLWELAESLLPKKNPGDFNQALMELGALVCLADLPKCLLCPFALLCEAHKKGLELSLPIRIQKKAIPTVPVSVALLWKNGRLLIQKRPEKGLLGGLWEFPGGKIEKDETVEEALRRELKEELGVEMEIERPLPTVKHAYTHFRVILHPFECRLTNGNPPLSQQKRRWVLPERLKDFAFPTANRKIFTYIGSPVSGNASPSS